MEEVTINEQTVKALTDISNGSDDHDKTIITLINEFTKLQKKLTVIQNTLSM
jgi:hypothetical protein